MRLAPPSLRGTSRQADAGAQVRDGTLYDGIFSGFRREGTAVGVLLKMARVLKAAAGAEPPGPGYQPELYVRPSDLVQVQQPMP